MTPIESVPEPRRHPPVTSPASAPRVDAAALIGALTAATLPIVAAMDCAEDEIAAASRRHPGRADAIYHAFAILLPRDIGTGMRTAFVYRSHVRELLHRVAARADLRPATAAEVCLALAHTSLQAPMHGPAAGLYLRMWQLAFPTHPLTTEQADDQVHYAHLHGARIDELEADLRHKLRDPDRQLGDIACTGRHHGRQVACTFAGR